MAHNGPQSLSPFDDSAYHAENRLLSPFDDSGYSHYRDDGQPNGPPGSPIQAPMPIWHPHFDRIMPRPHRARSNSLATTSTSTLTRGSFDRYAMSNTPSVLGKRLFDNSDREQTARKIQRYDEEPNTFAAPFSRLAAPIPSYTSPRDYSTISAGQVRHGRSYRDVYNSVESYQACSPPSPTGFSISAPTNSTDFGDHDGPPFPRNQSAHGRSHSDPAAHLDGGQATFSGYPRGPGEYSSNIVASRPPAPFSGPSTLPSPTGFSIDMPASVPRNQLHHQGGTGPSLTPTTSRHNQFDNLATPPETARTRDGRFHSVLDGEPHDDVNAEGEDADVGLDNAGGDERFQVNTILDQLVGLVRMPPTEIEQVQVRAGQLYGMTDFAADAATIRALEKLLKSWRGPPKPPNSDYFYKRMLKLKPNSLPKLDAFTKSLIANPTLDTLLSNQLDLNTNIPINSKTSVDLANAAYLNTVVTLISKTDTLDCQASIVRMLLCLFLYIAQHPNPAEWVSEARLRMATVDERVGEHLWDKYMVLLKDHKKRTKSAVSIMPKTKFLDQVKTTVDHGSKYAFIARHTSLGTLVYLLLDGAVAPHKLKQCSKGGEASGASKDAFRHLKKSGVVDKAEKLNRALHGLLWELVGKFNETTTIEEVAAEVGVEEGGWVKFPGLG